MKFDKTKIIMIMLIINNADIDFTISAFLFNIKFIFLVEEKSADEVVDCLYSLHDL